MPETPMPETPMPEIPVVRDAVVTDVPGISAMLGDDSLGRGRESTDPQIYAAAFQRMAAQDGNTIVVLEDAGGLLGCAQYTVIHGLSRGGMSRAQIEGVRVARHARGRGLGAVLIRALIDRARRDGCGLLQLTTDQRRPEAHRFYEKLGFQPSHVGMKLDL